MPARSLNIWIEIPKTWLYNAISLSSNSLASSSAAKRLNRFVNARFNEYDEALFLRPLPLVAYIAVTLSSTNPTLLTPASLPRGLHTMADYR